MPDPERILVPGSNGFFGRWICRALTRAGHRVIGTSRSGTDADPDARFDLRNTAAVLRAVGEAMPTVIVNAAGISSPGTARLDPAACFAANTGGTLNLLEAIRLAVPEARLVNLSSAAVYGASTDDPLDEEDPLTPHSVYGASKLAAEVLCGQYGREHGMPITTLRVFNLIGPGQPSDQAAAEFAGAVGTALGRQLDEARVTVGNPAISRDFTDVRDAAIAVAAVIDSGSSGTYNLCSGRATSLAELADLLSDLASKSAGRPFTARLDRDPNRTAPGDSLTIRGSNRRLAEATGWSPDIPIARSLSDLLGL